MTMMGCRPSEPGGCAWRAATGGDRVFCVIYASYHRVPGGLAVSRVALVLPLVLAITPYSVGGGVHSDAKPIEVKLRSRGPDPLYQPPAGMPPLKRNEIVSIEKTAAW